MINSTDMNISSSSSKKILIVGAFITVLLIVSCRYSNVIAPTVEKIRAVFSRGPCASPLQYSIGGFDDRFGISRKQFLDDAKIAADMWAAVAGKPLLEYSDSGSLKIDLIYDNRQQATVDIQHIGANIKDVKSVYDSEKAEYDALAKRYLSVKSSIDTKVASYKAELAAYQRQVATWNSGGATKQDVDSLESKRTKLNSDANAINTATQTLNSLASQVNSKAASLNQLAHKLNLSVKDLNEVGASTGVEFDEGEYVSDENGQRIDIYQYSDNQMLIRVLAHEMGHALGLDHVDDPKGIMYPLNQSTNMSPTAKDVSELKSVCGIR